MTEDCRWNHGSVTRRLALACARGSRQSGLVNELLVGRAPMVYRNIGGATYRQYGVSGVTGPSFRNLRRRLIQAGFVVVHDREKSSVIMEFPEEQY